MYVPLLGKYIGDFPLPTSIKANIFKNGKQMWVEGVVLDEMPSVAKCIVEIKGKELIMPLKDVKIFEKFKYVDGKCVAIEDFSRKFWNSLKLAVTEGFRYVLKQDISLLTFDDEENTIYYKNDFVSISLGSMEKTSLTRFVEVPCWEISVAQSIPGSRFEPPDVDLIVVGNCENTIGAAQLFVETIWKEEGRGFWDSLDYTIVSEAYDDTRWGA